MQLLDENEAILSIPPTNARNQTERTPQKEMNQGNKIVVLKICVTPRRFSRWNFD